MTFIKLIFGGISRVRAMTDMFERIGKDNLYIASRGVKSQIIKLLNYLGMEGYYDPHNKSI